MKSNASLFFSNIGTLPCDYSYQSHPSKFAAFSFKNITEMITNFLQYAGHSG